LFATTGGPGAIAKKKTLAVPEPPGLQQQLLSLMFPLQLL